MEEQDTWFVLNTREARWFDRGPRGWVCNFDPEGAKFPQVGINLFVLEPGQPMAMYHWEADQEDYLVLSGEALLIVDEEERPLRQWDFLHTPAGVPHVLVGAGSGPSVILAIGAREHQGGEGWGAYPVSDVAAKHDAASPVETSDAQVAYARFPDRQESPYREGWLPS